MATNGTAHEEHPTSSQSSAVGGNKAATQADLDKNEVGWYFVEQYYKTLNKAPEKLHLFYGKNSQYLVGKDAELTEVSTGRAAIQARIAKLDLDNCKVRISNVDAQSCDDKILIQTIGHTANKDGVPKKFVQTFVLAKQPSGYFVLNDIMRYMPDQDWEADETTTAAEDSAAPADQEAEAAAEPQAGVEMPSKEAEPVEPEAAVEEAPKEAAPEPEAEAAAPAAEAPAAEAAPKEEEPAAEEKAEPTPEPEAAAPEPAVEEPKKAEEPKETPAAPVAAAQAPAAAEPEKPRQPAKPMTWASRLAASGPVRPAVPVSIPKAATTTAAPQPRQPAPAAAPAAAPTPAAAQPTPTAQPTEAAPAPAAAKDQGSEWQTAETRRQNKAQPVASAPPKKDDTMAYIKFVTDKVQEEDLKTFLAGFGELEYFDINRQKNCAFVEFKTKAGYNAALTASTHTINGETINIEPRRPKANAYGGTNYNNPRGGSAPRGRGGFESGRGGSIGTGRGGSFGQSRGRGGAPRGRGAAQAGAA